MEKSSRGNNLPEDFVPDMFDLHEEQQKVHDSAQAGNDQTKNRLPAVEKKQMGSKTRIFSYKDKNFPLQKKEEEKKSKLEHYKLLELGTVESKMKQLNLSGLHQEEIVTSKKLQEYRKQQIARKAKDHLRNKEENGLSGRENNVESVAQETNQAGRALPGLEQMQYLPTQTQAKLSNRRHTTKESDCGSLVQPRQQKFVLTPTEYEDIQREIKEAERQLAQLMRDLKPQQKRKERIIRHTHALQMQQQHQEMHRPGQYVMPEGCAEGHTEDLSHLPSPPKEEATEHPGRATVRRKRQWNRNQPRSQPEGFHSMPPTGQSHSSDFTLPTNSSRPVINIDAHTVILNINDWSSFPKSIDTEV